MAAFRQAIPQTLAPGGSLEPSIDSIALKGEMNYKNAAQRIQWIERK
jgi:hypothetical protein